MIVATSEIGPIASSISLPPGSSSPVTRKMISSTTAANPRAMALQYEPRRPVMRRTSATSIAVSTHGTHVAGLAVGREVEEAVLEGLALAPDLGDADTGLDERPVDCDQPLVA